MKTHRSANEELRQHPNWQERWNGVDQGLVTCWERGREKRLEEPSLASEADNGRLVVLPWKGGVEKATKKKQKFGTLFYLAMWQGLRGEDLNIDATSDISVTCAVTGTTVVFTNDVAKYAEA